MDLWNRGITLTTNVTRRWTEKQIKNNNIVEKSLIFANFPGMDNGRCRELICRVEMNHPNYEKNAELIKNAPRMYNIIKDIVQTYEDDGLENMENRDIVIYKQCKNFIAKNNYG